jgi:hypothetical protein
VRYQVNTDCICVKSIGIRHSVKEMKKGLKGSWMDGLDGAAHALSAARPLRCEFLIITGIISPQTTTTNVSSSQHTRYPRR